MKADIMSNSQIETALQMIAEAQEELGCKFDLSLFRELVEINAVNPAHNKKAENLIDQIIESDRS